MEIAVDALEPNEVYRLLIGSVVPRPIAWITSRGADGRINAAPFSCYTFVSTVPPLVAISCGRKHGVIKDTVANAVEAGEFVLNVVSEEMLAPMHQSSAEFPAEISEVEALGIAIEPGWKIGTPRVAGAPASLECRTHQVLEFGALRTQLLVGEVVLFHVRDDCYRDGRIETAAVKPLARLGGPYYARLGEVLHMTPAAEYFHHVAGARGRPVPDRSACERKSAPMYTWHFDVAWDYREVFLRGALITLELSLAALAIGIVLGLLVGIGRNSRHGLISWPAAAFVEIFRSTPTLVQLVWIYYALPIITGVQLSAFVSVLIGLGLHTAAYMGEIFRAGVNSIDRGQTHAAQAIGMTYFQSMRRIILPQAVRRMVPPFINEFATLVKLTSLASVLAVSEILHEANNLITFTFRPMEIYTAVGVVFAVIVFPMIYLARLLERSWNKHV
jgi:polar amino acid transport system permease protein